MHFETCHSWITTFQHFKPPIYVPNNCCIRILLCFQICTSAFIFSVLSPALYKSDETKWCRKSKPHICCSYANFPSSFWKAASDSHVSKTEPSHPPSWIMTACRSAYALETPNMFVSVWQKANYKLDICGSKRIKENFLLCHCQSSWKQTKRCHFDCMTWLYRTALVPRTDTCCVPCTAMMHTSWKTCLVH